MLLIGPANGPCRFPHLPPENGVGFLGFPFLILVLADFWRSFFPGLNFSVLAFPLPPFSPACLNLPLDVVSFSLQ